MYLRSCLPDCGRFPTGNVRSISLRKPHRKIKRAVRKKFSSEHSIIKRGFLRYKKGLFCMQKAPFSTLKFRGKNFYMRIYPILHKENNRNIACRGILLPILSVHRRRIGSSTRNRIISENRVFDSRSAFCRFHRTHIYSEKVPDFAIENREFAGNNNSAIPKISFPLHSSCDRSLCKMLRFCISPCRR